MLFVSVKTVETHASKVFAKLGVRNRTELAAAVQRDPALLGNP
jgi:DNA-binding NarL/FixJ family response regulator